jgi:hypothetical protein
MGGRAAGPPTQHEHPFGEVERVDLPWAGQPLRRALPLGSGRGRVDGAVAGNELALLAGREPVVPERGACDGRALPLEADAPQALGILDEVVGLVAREPLEVLPERRLVLAQVEPEQVREKPEPEGHLGGGGCAGGGHARPSRQSSGRQGLRKRLAARRQRPRTSPEPPFLLGKAAFARLALGGPVLRRLVRARPS